MRSEHTDSAFQGHWWRIFEYIGPRCKDRRCATFAINAVARGGRTGALIQATLLNQRDLEEIKNMNLEVVPIPGYGYAEPYREETADYAIGKPDTHFKNLSMGPILELFEDIPKFQRLLEQKYQALADQNLSVAQSILAWIAEGEDDSDRLDRIGRGVGAALLGTALGYPACDVNFFVRSGIFGEEFEGPYGRGSSDPNDGHLRCPDCTRRSAEGT